MQLDFDDSRARDKDGSNTDAAAAADANDKPASTTGQATRAAAADAAKRLAAAAAARSPEGASKPRPQAAVPAPRATPARPVVAKAGAGEPTKTAIARVELAKVAVPKAGKVEPAKSEKVERATAAARDAIGAGAQGNEARVPEAPISMSDLPTIVDEDTVVPTSSEMEIVDHETVQSDAVEAIARTMREEDGDEPVSIKDLEMILAPGVAPPRIGKSGTSAPPKPPPRKRTPHRVHAPADSSARDLELMSRLSAPPTAARRDDDASKDEDEDIEPAPDSRMNDILGMAADLRAARPSAPTRTAKIDVAPDSGDVFALRGGLFDGSLMPTISPDLSLPTAPTESLPPLVSPTDPPPRSRGARAGRAAAVSPSAAPQAAPAQGTSKAGLWIGAIAVAAAALVALTRNPTHKDAMAPSEPERAPAAAAPQRAPVAPMAEEPSIDDTPATAKESARAPESAPASHAPQGNALQTAPAVAAPPVPANAQPAAPAAAQPASPKPVAPAAAAPPPSGADFDTSAASSALSAATGQASACRAPGDPSGTARVTVTFAPSGRVTSAVLSGPPFAGTQTGGCIARTLRTASVPAFSGPPVQVSRTINVR